MFNVYQDVTRRGMLEPVVSNRYRNLRHKICPQKNAKRNVRHKICPQKNAKRNVRHKICPQKKNAKINALHKACPKNQMFATRYGGYFFLCVFFVNISCDGHIVLRCYISCGGHSFLRFLRANLVVDIFLHFWRTYLVTDILFCVFVNIFCGGHSFLRFFTDIFFFFFCGHQLSCGEHLF